MSALTTTTVIQDAELNDGEQYNCFGFGGDYVLTALEVRGQINMAEEVVSDATTPNLAGSSVLIGAQIVPDGGEPASISSDQDSQQWLWVEYVAHEDTLGIGTTTGSSFTQYIYQQFVVARRWVGQLLVADGEAIYITTTSVADPKRTWVFSGTVRAFFDVRT